MHHWLLVYWNCDSDSHSPIDTCMHPWSWRTFHQMFDNEDRQIQCTHHHLFQGVKTRLRHESFFNLKLLKLLNLYDYLLSTQRGQHWPSGCSNHEFGGHGLFRSGHIVIAQRTLPCMHAHALQGSSFQDSPSCLGEIKTF